MTLFEEIVKEGNWASDYNNKNFFGLFTDLNNVVLDKAALNKLALDTLKQRGRTVRAQARKANEKLNAFKLINTLKAENELIKDKMKTVNEVATNLQRMGTALLSDWFNDNVIEGYNKTVGSKKGKTIKRIDSGKKPKFTINDKESTSDAKRDLKVYKMGTIDSKDKNLIDFKAEISRMQAVLNDLKNNNYELKGNNIDKIINSELNSETLAFIATNYNNIKGEILEKLGEAVLNSIFAKEYPSLQAKATGTDTDSRGKQIIQDIMVYSIDINASKLDDIDNRLPEKIDAKEKISVPASDMENGLKEIGKLQKYLFGIQAKSGVRQKLWNDVEFSIGELAKTETSLEQISNLLKTDWAKNEIAEGEEEAINSSSSTAAKIALQTVLGNTKFIKRLYHYSYEDGNALVLTENGFQTFEERMTELTAGGKENFFLGYGTDPKELALSENFLNQTITITLGGK